MNIEDVKFTTVTTLRGSSEKGDPPPLPPGWTVGEPHPHFKGLVRGADGIFRPEFDPEPRKALPPWPPAERGGQDLPVLDFLPKRDALGKADPSPVIWLMDPATGKAVAKRIRMRPDDHLGGVDD